MYPLQKGQVQNFIDSRGMLSVLEFNQLTIDPKRIFWMQEVASEETRGNHGHHTATQILICQAGKIVVEMVDELGAQTLECLEINEYILIPPKIWVSLKFESSRDILLVITDYAYDPSDIFSEKPAKAFGAQPIETKSKKYDGELR